MTYARHASRLPHVEPPLQRTNSENPAESEWVLGFSIHSCLNPNPIVHSFIHSFIHRSCARRQQIHSHKKKTIQSCGPCDQVRIRRWKNMMLRANPGCDLRSGVDAVHENSRVILPSHHRIRAVSSNTRTACIGQRSRNIMVSCER